MTRKRVINLILLAIVAAVVTVYFINPFETSDYDAWKESITEQDYLDAVQLLESTLDEEALRYTYYDYIEDVEMNYDLTPVNGVLTSPEATDRRGYTGTFVADLAEESTVTYEVEVTESGYYHIQTEYIVTSQILNNVTVSVEIYNEDLQANEQHILFDDAQTIDIPLLWLDDMERDEDGLVLYEEDKYGDETLPAQSTIWNDIDVKYADTDPNDWRQLDLYNNTYTSNIPLLFYFEEGTNVISIENVSNGDVILGDLVITPPTYIPTYEEYLDSNYEEGASFNEFYPATNYSEKNSSYVRLLAYNSPSVSPYDSVNKKLNVLDGEAWYKAGQEVTYTITVPEDGLYDLTFHYANFKSEFDVFRTIKIDGEVPFQEFESYAFNFTGTNWENETLNKDGEPLKVYLTAGEHTLTVRASKGNVSQYLRDLQLMIDHINEFALEIIKITGKDIDQNRTWKLTEYIVETESFLQAYDTIVKYIIVQTAEYSDKLDLSATLAYLKKSTTEFERMLEDPDELPLYLNNLYSGSASVTLLLGDTLEGLANQNFYLDGFYVSNDDNYSDPNAGFFEGFAGGFQSFVNSFTSDKFDIENDEDAIDVWVNRPITYVDIMQKMADSDPDLLAAGIKVNFSVMPDPGKLILANSAGNTPDVALGLVSYMPFDMAIRGALQDLTEFDDFWDFAGSCEEGERECGDFAAGALVPYILDDGVYAIPETLEFHSLVYRTDVFRSLDLDVPNTWDDVINILPTLQRYDMNFYYPTSGGTSLKWFYQTSPLIYQYGGSLYSEDGLSTTINSEESLAGLSLLGDLYTTYSLEQQTPVFFNSFRYNKLPVGIIDFSTYMALKNAAPELTGQWELALYPGVYNEDSEAEDNIDRWYIGNGLGGVMFKDADNKDDAWTFMKWWMSWPTQTDFAYRLQSTYGPEFLWLSGNKTAVEQSPIDNKDKEVIFEMFNWLRDVPRTPGQYMLERGLSDVWNTVTFDDKPIRVAVDEQVLNINREITRKLVEFGYLDNEGNVLKPYTIRDVDWIQEQMDNAKDGDN